ncbi:MAG: ParB/RepB/Spo0J family partition protein [Firmicutes bacterium]|nr:ParB/RepB/Spo0J family partition protein [Bacillota bacterium]
MKLTEVLLNRKRSEGLQELETDSWSEKIESVPIELIKVGKYQPRQEFDENALAELAESIKVHGLLQPVMLRKANVGYELIVGERRLRACKSLGWEVIPAIIRNVEDKEAAELALIENLQRADLHVFEIAEGYQRLLTEFDLTQDDLATRLGISQANVANKIRLLKLPVQVREVISREMLSERHARALLKLKTVDDQLSVLAQIIEQELSVAQTEELVNSIVGSLEKPKKKDGQRKGSQKLVIKDLRLFSNSVRQLINTLQSSGLVVTMDEREDDEAYEVLVRVEKRHGGESNG